MNVGTQVALSGAQEPEPGLRERKKTRTRSAIEDAALALFEQRGYETTTIEEIAAVAEVSTTTFFRYYPSKAEVLLGDHGHQLPALLRAIVERPAEESDLEAFHRAVQEEWVAAVDPQRTARKARIVATSEALSGLSFHRGHRWLDGMVAALAQRSGLTPDDERCALSARVGLEALASAVDRWIGDDCTGALADYVDTSFERMVDVCGELSRTRRSLGSANPARSLH
jgi:AcrR family transcriptional regulator